MSVTVQYKKDDTIPLQYTIEEWNIDTQGTEAYDLANKTVTFSMIKDGDFNWSIENQPCTVVSASEGIVEYIWASGETATTGIYKCVFRVTDANGKISSFPEYDVQWLWIVDDSTV